MEVAKREAADLAEQRRAEAEKDIAEKRSTPRSTSRRSIPS